MSPPTNSAQLQNLLGLVSQYDAMTQGISVLNTPGATLNIGLSAPGLPGVTFSVTVSDPSAASALVQFFTAQQAAILPQLQAAGITP